MKKSLTLRLRLLGVLAVILGMASAVQAQREFTLEVMSPAGIAGTYDVVHAAFGPFCSTDTVTAEFAIVEDELGGTEACDAVVNDMTGKIALVDRGSCNFSLKCYNAQQAGAIGVIVCNNNADPIFAMAAGDFADDVTVPSVMLSQADCQLIRNEIPTVMVSLQPNTDQPPGETVPVYYEENFDDGPNGWTSTSTNEPDEIYFWEETGFFPTAFGGTTGINILGASCTGAMGCPSGWYQTGMTGIIDSVPPNPAQYIDFDIQLNSPILDLSGITDNLSLKFDQTYRKLNSNGVSHTFITYSIDGGNTFSEAIPINEEVVVNDPAVSNTLEVPIPGIQGESQVVIRFNYAQDFYFHVIDNVRLIRRENNDLRVQENFFAVAPNIQTPANQVECFGFLADIFNAGGSAQPNVNLNISIVDNSTSTEVYSDDKDYGTIDPDVLAENGLFGNAGDNECFTPDGSITSYTGTYTVSSDSIDAKPEDNTISFTFEVTDSTFAKEVAPTTAISPVDDSWAEGEPHQWAFGNHYHVVNGSDVGDTYAKQAVFAISGNEDLANKIITIALYKWVDANDDETVNTTERSLVGRASYVIEGTETFDQLITVDLSSSPIPNVLEPVSLESNTDYVLMVEYTPNDEVTLPIGSSDVVDYGAMVFRADSVMVPRYASILGISGDLSSEDYGTVGFTPGYQFMPVARLVLGVLTPVSTTELSADNIVKAMPNPADRQLTIQLDMVNQQDKVTLELMNTQGQRVSVQSLANVQQEVVEFDVSALPAGNYFLHVSTDEGVRTERVVVQH